MPAANVGYPDGDNRPTVTMDYRRTYTMTPNSQGELSFGVGTSYYGCFIKGAGTLTTSVPFRPSSIQDTGVLSLHTATTTAADGRTGLVPIVAPDAYTNMSFRAYRPIVAVAESMFTGSSMYNGGSVTIAKTATASGMSTSSGSGTGSVYLAVPVDPVMSATAVVGPARDTYSSRVVPADPEFQAAYGAATDQSATSSDLCSNVLVSNSAVSTSRKVYSVPCAQAGAVWYHYTGLDASASITVNVRYCVQYVVDGDSAMVPLARPSPAPPENPGILSRVFSAITSSPAAMTFAANTVGHLVPSSRPLLAIAAEAYNHG